MTSNPGMNQNSVLPPDARTARIASGGGGGLAASARHLPADGNGVPSGFFRTGQEPDDLDFPGMAGRRVKAAASCSGPRFEEQPNKTTIHHN